MSSSRFDYPGINVGEKTNEANIHAIKSYLDDLSDQLNYYISYLEEKVEALETIVSNMTE